MRGPILSGAVLVMALGFAAGQDKKPEKYVSKDGRYAVLFPDTPSIESKKLAGLALTTATAQKGSGGFVVVYCDLPAEVIRSSTAKEILASGETGIVANYQAKVTASKSFDYGKQKYQSREIRAEKDEGEKGSIHLRVQIVLAGNRLYQLTVAGRKETVEGKDAEDFFQSFEITK